MTSGKGIWSTGLGAALCALLLSTLGCGQAEKLPRSGHTAFRVAVAESLRVDLARKGRLFVVLSRKADPEPRFGPGWASAEAEPFFGLDVQNWSGETPAEVGSRAYGFPVPTPSDLAPGRWYAQALYDVDTTFSGFNAPGNLYSDPIPIDVAAPSAASSLTGGGSSPGGESGGVFELQLSRRIPPEQLPDSTEYLRFVRLESPLLSGFWGKPMFLRAAVVLPRGYDDSPAARYPIAYFIGGYGARYDRVLRQMREGSAFREMWLDPETPRMIFVYLDGEAPFGDSYQTNSDNNGPYGDATVRELVPAIESRYRATGSPDARFVSGGSTGGWASLALQVFYPDDFNGVWSFCADAVDFRAFQLVDVYADSLAYVNEFGIERPSMRATDGEPMFSIRREVRMENALGRGNTYVTGGGQWGAWNAVYGPRGPDGRPVAIWDPETGRIDSTVAETWRRYDLRQVVESNWARLGPNLRGKLHLWMGDMDSFYLNNAMHLFADMLASRTDPPSDAVVEFGPLQGHCWQGISMSTVMAQMMARVP